MGDALSCVLGFLGIGQKFDDAFEGLPGRTFAGTVARLAGALDVGTRTMLVEVDLLNADGRIRPGFYGRAELTLERRENVLALPRTAVRDDRGNAYVYTVGSDDTARRTPVTLGLEDAGFIEIEAGLSGNERVIAGAAPNVNDGASVRLVTP